MEPRETAIQALPPTHLSCAWCAQAAGGTADAWRSQEQRPLDAALAHAMTCAHNPLVRAAAKLCELFDKDPKADDVNPSTYGAFLSLRKLVRP